MVRNPRASNLSRWSIWPTRATKRRNQVAITARLRMTLKVPTRRPRSSGSFLCMMKCMDKVCQPPCWRGSEKWSTHWNQNVPQLVRDIRSPNTWDYYAVSFTEASSRFMPLRVHGQHDKGNILQGPSAEYLTPYWWSWWTLKNWRLWCVGLNCILYVDRALLTVCRSGSYPSERIHLESKLGLHIAPFAFEYFLPGLIIQFNCDFPFKFWSFILRPNGIESGFTILSITHMSWSVCDRTNRRNRT